MSMESHYYVIAGYDLTGCETDKFKDWKWTEKGEDYINNQCKGEIQFFNDPMSGSYLYFGYILISNFSCSFVPVNQNLRTGRKAWLLIWIR